MEQLKSYFKIQLKQLWWRPSIREIRYTWADWLEYTWLEFEWYASTNELDRGWEIVLPEAFADTTKEFMENSMMLLQHDTTKPIWSFTNVVIDQNWLFVKWLVKVDIDNIFQKLRTWVLKTMSIGYHVVDWWIENINGVEVFIIKKLELLEISLVSVPMNAWSKIKSNLSDDEFVKLYQIDKEDNYSLTKSLMDLKAKNVSIDTEKKEVITTEIIEDVKSEIIIEEKWCDKLKKPKGKSLMINEIIVGDMVRYVKKEDENFYWDYEYEEEIYWDVKEASIWEIIKIISDKILGTTVWILKYELTINWFAPTNQLEMIDFEEVEMIKVSNTQIKSIASKQTIKTIEVSEKSAWDIAEKSIDNIELEKKFFDFKENSIKEVKNLFEEESKKLEIKSNEFADILFKALEVLNDTNEKALEYISKLENSPVAKSFRYLEKWVKKENTFTEMIKGIKK